MQAALSNPRHLAPLSSAGVMHSCSSHARRSFPGFRGFRQVHGCARDNKKEPLPSGKAFFFNLPLPSPLSNSPSLLLFIYPSSSLPLFLLSSPHPRLLISFPLSLCLLSRRRERLGLACPAVASRSPLGFPRGFPSAPLGGSREALPVFLV